MRIFSDCTVPTALNATITISAGSEGVNDAGGEVVISGGTVQVDCNYTLFNVGIGNGTEQSSTVTLTCTDTLWDDADADWQCLPTC